MKELRVSIKLPDSVPVGVVEEAERAALESAVLNLWQKGHLSTRAAAERLSLSYYDYTELVSARGLSLVTDVSSVDELDAAYREIEAEGRSKA